MTPEPSKPPQLEFNPFATGFAVFTWIAIPAIVLGYTRPAGPSTVIIVVGIVVGLLAGVIVGLWVGHRDGRVWRGPQL